MARFLGIGLLVLLLAELMSIVWMTDWLGGAWTILLMAASFVLGVVMLRNTGVSGLLLAAAAMKSGGRVSVYQMLWPIRYTLAAVCLMSPGFLSSVFAVLLLLPIKGKANLHAGNADFFQHQPFAKKEKFDDEDIIEGDFTVSRDDTRKKGQAYIEHKREE